MADPGKSEKVSGEAQGCPRDNVTVPPGSPANSLGGLAVGGELSSSNPRSNSPSNGAPLSFETMCVAPRGIPTAFQGEELSLDELRRLAKGSGMVGGIPRDPLECEWDGIEIEDARSGPGMRGLRRGENAFSEIREKPVVSDFFAIFLIFRTFLPTVPFQIDCC